MNISRFVSMYILCAFFLQYSTAAFCDPIQSLGKTKKSQSSSSVALDALRKKPTNSPVIPGRSEGCVLVYNTKKGDSVSRILQRFGMKSEDFYRRNEIRGGMLRVKQSLCIVPGAIRMVASFYGEEFRGKRTSNGERFNPDDLTAAHKSYPEHTVLRVTNPETNQSVEVRVNDRGPYAKGRDLDLSESAAAYVGVRGVKTLLVQVVSMPQKVSKV